MNRPTRARWRVLDRLAGQLRDDPRVEAVILYGSLAHGRARHGSDIDLIVVADDLTSADVKTLAPRRWRRALGVTVRSFGRLHPEQGTDWSLLCQLHHHGRPLIISPRVRELLAMPRPPRELLLARHDRNAVQAADPLLAHRMARRNVFLANAAAGVHVHGRGDAFAAFAGRHPELRGDLALILRACRRPARGHRTLMQIPAISRRHRAAAQRILAVARDELSRLPG